ncbi:transglycosylase domain-containing protein [Labrys monachus]|uniref:peptidoglycan glycosyltransferase n=1 Tax=Labrys monachus TaxID=217067 RepID=A0ABU0FIX3_9HYPH|nr:PBP1A family penicillin-binding protein [Labrys monachus]MDQ0394550.1 penicillin-binding protein 1A [Labrys monachus]
MPDHEPRSPFRERLSRQALRLDSWLDNAVFVTLRSLRRSSEWVSDFSNRFHVTGWRRLLVEVGCESLTLGVAILFAALILAMPAMTETGKDWLRRADIAVTFEDRYGTVIGQRGIRSNDSVELADMPDYVVKAVLATEDRRFYDHFGIDVIGTFRALTVNSQANGVVQGGSSITQQLAKNLFLSNQRTVERKIREAYLALWLEGHLTKDEILKLYLDRAYMGGGAFGIEAASQYYFGKSVRDVSLAEAAMLAGLFKAPTKYAPTNNLAAARGRANQVLSNLVDAGFMTEGQVSGARRNPATPVDRAREKAPDYYLDWAYGEIADMADDGDLGDQSVFVVRTALDPAVQSAAENTLESVLRQYGQDYEAHQGAIVIMDPEGSVRAMVGGRDYSQSQFNRATDAQRQPGSSFKPFVYTTALMNGFTPQSVVVDSPVCIKNWCPQNFERRFEGPVTLTQALTHSINVIPVKLSLALSKNAVDGRRMIIDTAHMMGIESELKESWALPIGVEAVNLLEMTGAYGVFASGGHKARPHAAMEIRNAKGGLLYAFDAARENPVVIAPPIVEEMNGMLNSVVENGTGRRAQLPGIKVAGKTGTTNAYRDAWFIGFTGNFVGGVWFGNDNFQPSNKMTGGSLPAMTWQQVMSVAHQGVELRSIPGVAPFPADQQPKAAGGTADGGASAAGAPFASMLLPRNAVAVLHDIGSLVDAARAAAPRQAALPRRSVAE